MKELRKAYLDEKRRGIESREDILMKIQKREKEPAEPDFQVKVESKKSNMNNFEQKINID